MNTELAGLSDLARTIALEATDLIRTALESTERQLNTKSSPTDMVTEVDRASEDLIVRRIREARPDDGLLGEEGTSIEGSSGYRWVFDPIDGTMNFIHGHPGFSVSIAVELDGRPVVGVISDVMQRELFSAVLGGGATRNDRPIQASGITDSSRAVVATGFSFDPERRGRQGQAVARLLPKIADIRRMGAAAVDLCSVACGRVDGYFERGLNPWDVAAGQLIATEAGAVAGSIDGGAARPDSMLVAPAAIFERLRELIAEAEAAGPNG